jgi:hypothetical protein
MIKMSTTAAIPSTTLDLGISNTRVDVNRRGGVLRGAFLRDGDVWESSA